MKNLKVILHEDDLITIAGGRVDIINANGKFNAYTYDNNWEASVDIPFTITVSLKSPIHYIIEEMKSAKNNYERSLLKVPTIEVTVLDNHNHYEERHIIPYRRNMDFYDLLKEVKDICYERVIAEPSRGTANELKIVTNICKLADSYKAYLNSR